MKTELWVRGNADNINMSEIAEQISQYVKSIILGMDPKDFVIDKEGNVPKRGVFLKVSKGAVWPEGNFFVKAASCDEPEDLLWQVQQLQRSNDALVKRSLAVSTRLMEPFDFDAQFQIECDRLGVEP